MKSILIQAAWFCILLASLVTGLHAAIFDVMKFGAKADGKTDDSKAFVGAWGAACKAAGANTITAAGKYMAGPILFQGPCKGAITIEAHKMIMTALPDPYAFKGQPWVTFSSVHGLTINGGTFDGNGAAAWKLPECGKKGNVCRLPANLYFNVMTGLKIIGVTNKNSKQFHMTIGGCKDVTIQNYTVDTPGDAPNTDGVHIGKSSKVSIIGASIKTGDDCVSLGDGVQDVHVEKVTCGPSHGLAIGSLGKYPNEKPVLGITVKNCTLTGCVESEAERHRIQEHKGDVVEQRGDEDTLQPGGAVPGCNNERHQFGLQRKGWTGRLFMHQRQAFHHRKSRPSGVLYA
nr:exopolygalacturonase clone GBGA483-like [Ipomoea batatas]